MPSPCRKCGLHRFRRQIVRGHGARLAEIAFIGEAPGKTENLLGYPFCGASGKLLHDAIKDAGKRAETVARTAAYFEEMAGLGVKVFFAVVIPENPDTSGKENFELAVRSYGELAGVAEGLGAMVIRHERNMGYDTAIGSLFREAS